MDEQNQQERAEHRFARAFAHCGNENSCCQGKKKRVRQHQRHAPQLIHRHAAQQQRNRQHGENCEQTINAIQRGGRQFAQHDVVPPQIGEKQQSERPLALLFTQTIGRVTNARRQTAQQKKSGKNVEYMLAQFLRRRLRFKNQCAPENEDGRQR